MARLKMFLFCTYPEHSPPTKHEAKSVLERMEAADKIKNANEPHAANHRRYRLIVHNIHYNLITASL
jgi:hypothetical protein